MPSGQAGRDDDAPGQGHGVLAGPVAGADAASLPAPFALKDLPDADREDAVRRERSLLYVAATRARDELVVLWTGEPSDLLPGLVRTGAPLGTAR